MPQATSTSASVPDPNRFHRSSRSFPRSFFQASLLPLLLLLAALCAPTLPAQADCTAREQAVRLFRNYSLGMSRQEVLAGEGAYDCAEALGPDAVCMDAVEFLGQNWSLDFAFSSQGLNTVSLRAPFSRELYARSFAALDERFELVSLQSDAEPLDLVALWRKSTDSGEASRRMSEYEAAGMARSNLAYVFLERWGVQQALDQAASVKELLAGARPGTRSAGLVLRRDPAGQDWIVLQFDVARTGTRQPGTPESAASAAQKKGRPVAEP
ncbi:MAG: hypothetical protein AB7E32_04210 [Desulfovibrio sp.]